ncbi:MAG: ExeM/NucH family extracellular endonuclease [Chloroflexi bacterium]|nr:ExeM/NucH family extracellular endonuclease [Chloroflexota bacterium]
MQKNVAKYLLIVAVLAALVGSTAGGIHQARAVSSNIVITQIYGGGGNAGSTYTNDYIEIFNLGTTPVNLAGWSVQYAGATAATWSKTDLTGTIQPGQYFLIQEAAGSGGTQALPTPDVTGTIAMSATGGKIALVSSTTALSGACPSGVIDLIGFGTANCFETAVVPALTNTLAAKRIANGCTDTDNNSTDFMRADPTVVPTPRNTASTLNLCSVPADTAPSVSGVTPATGAIDVPVNADVIVTFSEDVSLTNPWFTLVCSASGAKTAAVSGGPASYTINPDTDFSGGETCTLTVTASNVSDVDANDPPDTMAADFTSTFTVVSSTPVCDQPFTPIYTVQGSGDTAAITGTVTIEGIVVSDDEGASPALGGFYVQDVSGDGNPSTSDGIFVGNGTNNNVSNGDIVRVTGSAGEYQGETQLSAVVSIVGCGTDTLIPVDISLPFANPSEKEQYEGMLVRVPQTLYVTDNYFLGRFGEVTLSGSQRLDSPTDVALPGAPALAVQAANDLNRIILDDGLMNQNPDPILFGRGGTLLSAANTLRGGDAVTGLVGVMAYGWGGVVASPNAYRIRPLHALGGGVPNFSAANPRPASPPATGGSIRAASMNLLNYFNTFGVGACANGIGGSVTDCRGANDSAEFARQSDKLVNAILAVDADVLGVMEIENDGHDSASAIQDLVNKLNAIAGAGTYSFIDADARVGRINALGGDAVKVGILYQPANVTPVGATAVLDTTAFVNGGDASARNRVSLLQAFQTAGGERFLFNVNHLKSKGSACDAADAGDGQGNCNIVRANAVNELINWYASDPTGTGDPDLLIAGDFNSYAKEDPIAALESAGYVNMINHFNGTGAYSYVFDGQWGSLDYVFASPSLLAQVSGAADWHINADEPVILDYNTEFKSAGQVGSLYSAEPFRASDHDPLLAGLSLDSVAPDIQIDSHPTDPSASGSADFSFSSPEALVTFECKLDNNIFSPCNSPINYSGLNDGAHSFQVRAKDAIGNVDATPASFIWTVESGAPIVISNIRGNASPTNTASVNFIVTFSEVVTGVDRYDFSLTPTGDITNASIISVSGIGSTRIITVNTGTGSGTLQLNLIDNNTIKDMAKNPLGGLGLVNGDFTTGEAYVIDKVPPSVSSIVRMSADNTSAAYANFLVTFTKPVAGVDKFDFNVITTGTISEASIISVAYPIGTTRKVTILLGNGSGTVHIDLIDNGTIRDDARNYLGGAGLSNGDYTNGETYTIERTPPTVVSITRGNADPSGASTVKYVVTFSESVTGVDKYDFNLTAAGGVSGASIVSVGGIGSVRTIIVNTGAGSGTLQLDLIDNDSIRDAKNNRLGGVGAGNGDFSGPVYTINKP